MYYGFQLILRGKFKSRNEVDTFILMRSRCDIYRERKNKKQGDLSTIVLHNQKIFMRVSSGCSMVRMARTMLPMCKNEWLKLNITVVIDQHGKASHYYMKGEIGYTKHTSHAKWKQVTRTKKVFTGKLSDNDVQVFQDIGYHNFSFIVARYMVKERTGELVSYS